MGIKIVNPARTTPTCRYCRAMSLPGRARRMWISSAVVLLIAALLSTFSSSPSAAVTGTGTISGTILDQNGKPAQWVQVNVFPPGGEYVASAQTDSTGHYAITGLAPGTYNLNAEPPDDDWNMWYPSHGVFATDPNGIVLDAGETEAHDAVMDRPAWLVVSVIDSLGNPITDVGAWAAVDGDPNALCDRAVSHTPAPPAILVPCDRVGALTLHVAYSVGGSEQTETLVPLTVTDGEIKQVTVTVPAFVKASGRITTSAGTPLSGVSLLGSAEGCSMGAGPTGSTGRFSVSCLANTSGRYDVTTRSLSYINRTLTVTVGTVAKNLGDIHLSTAAKAKAKIVKNTGYSLTNGPCLKAYRWSGTSWVLNTNVKSVKNSTTTTLGGARSGTYKFLATECYPDWGYASPSPTPSHERKWVAGGKHYAMKAGQTLTLPTTTLRPAYNTTLSISKITPPVAAGGSASIAVRVVASGTTAGPTGTFGFEIQDVDGNGAVFTRSLPSANDGKLTVEVPNLATGTYDVVVTFRGSYRFRDVRYPVKGTLIVP